MIVKVMPSRLMAYGLQFLAIEIDELAKMQNADLISTEIGGVSVCPMHTDEQVMLATYTCRISRFLIDKNNNKGNEYGQKNASAIALTSCYSNL